MCRNTYRIKLRFVLRYFLYFNSSFTITILGLLCLVDQLMPWCELVDKIECSWCFHIFDLWFWFLWFWYDYVKLFEGFNHMNITYWYYYYVTYIWCMRCDNILTCKFYLWTIQTTQLFNHSQNNFNSLHFKVIKLVGFSQWISSQYSSRINSSLLKGLTVVWLYNS